MKQHALAQWFSPEQMHLAWYRYMGNTTPHAHDNFGIDAFSSSLDENLSALSNKILTGSFTPVRPLKYYKPKRTGTQRVCTILRVEDALLYHAVANTLAALVYVDLDKNREVNYGYVLSPDTKSYLPQAIDRRTQQCLFSPIMEKYKEYQEMANSCVMDRSFTCVLTMDIARYFDSIPHYNVLHTLEAKYSIDEAVLNLLSLCMNCWSGCPECATPGVGIPQDCDPSYLLSNIVLTNFDDWLREKEVQQSSDSNQKIKYLRYVDDIRIYAANEHRLRVALVELDKLAQQYSLSLNVSKTTIETLPQSSRRRWIIEFDDYEPPLPEWDQTHINGDIADVLHDDSSEAIPDYSGSMKETLQIMKEAYDNARQLVKLISKHVGVRDLHWPRKAETDLVRIARQYSSRLRLIAEANPLNLPIVETNAVWLDALTVLFWRADRLCEPIAAYPPNNHVKERLLDIAGRYSHYDWVHAKILDCLAESQNFSENELLSMLNTRRNHCDWYVAKSIYALVLRHCASHSLLDNMLTIARQEEPALKREILYVSRELHAAGITKQQLSHRDLELRVPLT
ncbi:MAG: RNA-directed DNA polymerase [bacterium]|nr:RNA-directed DNA polymerase [bacterium]